MPGLTVTPVTLTSGSTLLSGDMTIPAGAQGIVLFAHGSGSSRKSVRNRYVAQTLNQAGLATLLMDLLSEDEEMTDRLSANLRFDIPFLAERLSDATRWLLRNPETKDFSIGYFGASTGAAAALLASTRWPEEVRAVVSRGGRPDLAEPALERVSAPTLLIVGGEDHLVIPLNEEAYETIPAVKELVVVPGATHLFEEPGALEQVAQLSASWFKHHLKKKH